MQKTLQTEGLPLLRKGRLLHILGVGFGLAVVVGSSIGMSIFRLPGPVTALLGAPALILLVWVLGGVYTLFSANYTSELATMLPQEGGPFVYAQRALGPYAGFLVGWTSWFGETSALAFLSIALGEFSVILFAPHHPGAVSLIALGALVFMGAVNLIGVKVGSSLQKWISALKATALLLFVAACFIWGHHPAANDVPSLNTPSSPAAFFISISLAFQLVITAYGGWMTALYFSEEDIDPAHDIPRSLHGGILLVAIIYLLVVSALLYVLPLPQFAASRLAVADAMQLVVGPQGSTVITAVAVLSVLGVLNASLMFLPRILYGLGKNGLCSLKATLVNQGGTPVVALLLSLAAAMLLTQLSTFEILLGIYAFFNVANNILLLVSLFVLRKREPGLRRPFKTWGYPIAPLVLLVVSIALFIGYIISNTVSSLFALGVVAVSYPLYRLTRSLTANKTAGTGVAP